MGLELTTVVNSTVQTRRKPLMFASTLQESLEELLDKFVMNHVVCKRTDRQKDKYHHHRYYNN